MLNKHYLLGYMHILINVKWADLAIKLLALGVLEPGADNCRAGEPLTLYLHL